MNPDEIRQWRKAERVRLLGAREGIAAGDRREWNEAITRFVIEGFAYLEHVLIGFCWPFKGEPDPRFAVRHFRDHGARAALPVVVEKRAPLQFREWWPGVATSRGVFDLPVPEGTETVQPDALLIPPIGFDARGYRLGYGGGYFDRTLASMTPQPLRIALAYEISRIPTIHPQPHDIAMDFVVTERGIHRVTSEGLELVDAARSNALTQGRHA